MIPAASLLAGASLLVHGAAPPSGALPPEGEVAPRALPVPILMYHRVLPAPEKVTPTVVSEDALAAHLLALRRAGWHVVGLGDVLAHLTTGAPLPSRAVALTFDDGWLEHFWAVLPLLRDYSVTATFFVATDPLDANWPAYMHWEEVRALHEAGMSVGAHTASHRSLVGLGAAELAWELESAAEAIGRHTGARPRILAYPYGAHDERVRRAAASAGYVAAVTTNPDPWASGGELLTLPRLEVSGACGPSLVTCPELAPYFARAAAFWGHEPKGIVPSPGRRGRLHRLSQRLSSSAGGESGTGARCSTLGSWSTSRLSNTTPSSPTIHPRPAWKCMSCSSTLLGTDAGCHSSPSHDATVPPAPTIQGALLLSRAMPLRRTVWGNAYSSWYHTPALAPTLTCPASPTDQTVVSPVVRATAPFGALARG